MVHKLTSLVRAVVPGLVAILVLVVGMVPLEGARAGGKASPKPPAAPEIDFAAIPGSASARPTNPDGKPHQAHARLIADRTSVAPGSTFRLGLHLEQDEGWHSYWKSPGDIGLPTDIEWTLPEGAVATPYQYPVPQRFEEKGIVSFGYEDEVLLFTEVTLPADLSSPSVELGASWLVCKTTCIPGSVELSLPLQVGAELGEPSPWAPLFDHFAAQHPTPPLEVGDLGLEGALSASAVRPNEAFTAVFLATPTGEHPLGGLPEEGVWPTFTPIVTYDWMVNAMHVCAAPGGGVMAVIEGETFEPDPLPPADRIGGLFQVEVDGRWVRTEYTVPMPWAPTGAEVQPGASPLLTMAEGCKDGMAAAAELGEPPPPEQDASIVALEQITGLSGGALFALMLVAAFVGGVILNAMPCVLPVLTLKLYGLVSHAEAGAAYNRRAGLAYTLGILVSFWALALAVVILKVAFSTSAGWGFQMQSPVFVAVLATIVFGFSLSLFGVFEIPAMGTDAASRATQRGGLAGDFLYGAFATLLSTPCSAPFLGPAVGFALSQSIPSIFLFFSLIGLGLAAPYLAVAFVPALFRLMPKPGAWMETFKQLMGFTLVATTLWLVSFLPKQVGIDSTIGFLAFLGTISLGLWIFGHWGGLEHTWRRQLVALGVGVVVAVGGGWLFLDLSLAEDEPVQQGLVTEGLDFEEEIPWQPFSDENVAALAGRTVFIDFTADWCLTCKVNELTVLETRTVREAMAAHEVVPLKADWTRRDPVIGEWLKRYGRAGVPFYLVIPAEAGAETIPLSEVITPDMVVDALERGS